MKKTFYTLFLLFLCLCCLPISFAEAQNVDVFEPNAFRIARKAYSNGEISISYIFPLNSKLMKEEGFSEEDVQTFRFYLATYVNALAKSNAENACEGVSVSNCVYFTDVDGMGFSILFPDLNAQKEFFGVKDDSSSEQTQKSSGFFIKKVEFDSIFPISSAKSAGDLKMVNLMAVSSWSNNTGLSQEKKEKLTANFDDSIFIYDFATQSSGLKSEIMYQDENFYHNVFCKSLSEIEENPSITFWVTSANKPVWCIFALVVVFMGMIVAWLVVKMRRKKANFRKKSN